MSKHPYIKSQKVYACIWEDAHYNTEEADNDEHVHRPWVYVTVGVLIKSDEIGVSLSCDMGEDGKWRGRNFIPRSMVLDEYEIGPLRGKKPKKSKAKPQSVQTLPEQPQ